MDVAPAHGHAYEVEQGHRPGLHSGGEEEHHEKKSVLKKVKDKAKKIKDTIGKKRHGHGEEHGHGASSRSSDEEEEEEEGYDVEDGEGEQEPEVHGAPMYESEAARVLVSRQEGDMGKEMLAAGQLEDDHGAPKRGAGEAVPGSYQTGVVGSAASPGGPEPGVIRSFQALSVSDEPGKEREGASAAAVTGSHDQFFPESRPAHGEEAAGTAPHVAVGGEAGPERRETQEQQPHREKSYTEKISSAIVEKASGTAPHVAVGGEAGPERRETQEQQPHREKSYTEKISSAIVEKAGHAKDAAVSAAVGSAEYSKKIAETVYGKVAAGGLATGLGSAVAPQLQQKQEEEEEEKKKDKAGSSTSAGAAAEAGGVDKSAKRVSMREYLAEKLSPGEEDRALCEVISEAMQKSKEDERDVRHVREEVEETTGASSPGEKKAGKGMVGTIKGAVTSLFGGSHGQAPPAQARGEAMDSSPVEQGGGPRLQEFTS